MTKARKQPSVSGKTNGAERLRGMPLMPALILSFGIFVLVAVSAVQALQWYTGRGIIREFASRLIERALATEEAELRDHLNAAIFQAKYVASALSDKRYEISDPALQDFAAGAFAAAPQITALLISDPEGHALRAVRDDGGGSVAVNTLDLSHDPAFSSVLADVDAFVRPHWGRPVFIPEANTTFLTYRVPVWVREDLIGVVIATVSTGSLSRLTARLSDPPRYTAFILYDHDYVLAHPFLINGFGGQTPDVPLPLLNEFSDGVITDYNDIPEASGAFLITPPPGAVARETMVGRKPYLIVSREVAGFNNLPLTVGAYSLKSAVDAPLRIFYWAMGAALVVLALSLVAAAILGAYVSRPIRRAAVEAAKIGRLDFGEVNQLPITSFREVNELSRSFNAMLEGLMAFGRYVPHSLVNVLIKEGRVGAGTEEKELAIMFTDIASFTETCESLSANEVADFINQHLTLVSACIEREGGTIDKYIGDAVMAFWGAPGHVDNPAVSAARAALEIRKAIAADNQHRIKQGLRPVRIRIGIHAGPVVVGDIGAPERINYTIVGDAVNTTQRLEGLGKIVNPQAESIVLVSENIADSLTADFSLEDKGMQRVKGKLEELRVYELLRRN
ncbi:adenylate/guanylate cyclase domain-containing protein [Limibacillus halophilus]|uniref:Adenylate cyclase n=1 Tax=Limibacillus halophilus TaxID=1579333 RepID=A0A839SYP3_9PROT|nr:adenylate/guanylate cyclase domain-containing protein [Limibacillus halophilus]MBB3066155.1 adenylate cyclase [Limibacillus halophilus]